MAVYKVPQDVEADDKLIGPFSFRQFIYLIVVAISMAGMWGLSQVFIPLAIIPLPIVLFFAALALPLRKDQPMEAYLSAVVSFYFLKSRKRLWQPDGIESFVTIIPPKNSEKQYTKDLDTDEATKRLDYLANLVDTHGWSIRGAGATPDTSLSTDLYYEGKETPDMMDEASPAAVAMKQQLDTKATEQRQTATEKMVAATPGTAKVSTDVKVENPSAATAPIVNTPAPAVAPAATTTAPQPVGAIDRADESRRRHNREEVMDALTVANGLAEVTAEERGVKLPAANTTPVPKLTDPEPGPAITELTMEQARSIAGQPGVSVQTMSEQANRQAQKNKVLKSGDEVKIKLR